MGNSHTLHMADFNTRYYAICNRLANVIEQRSARQVGFSAAQVGVTSAFAGMNGHTGFVAGAHSMAGNSQNAAASTSRWLNCHVRGSTAVHPYVHLSMWLNALGVAMTPTMAYEYHKNTDKARLKFEVSVYALGVRTYALRSNIDIDRSFENTMKLLNFRMKGRSLHRGEVRACTGRTEAKRSDIGRFSMKLQKLVLAYILHDDLTFVDAYGSL